MSKLRPFQQEGVQKIKEFRGRALLGDEMGLGKTIQTLYWVSKIKQIRPVVIVCPSSVKYTWQSEASAHFGMRIEVLEGNHRDRIRQLPGPIVVLNYDILKSWLPLLIAANPQCVILDEIHYLKSPGAQRTKAGIKLAQHPSIKSVVGLSGTPFTNRPVELWAILQCIRPDIFPSFQKFAWRYCKPRYTPWGWQYTGATHKEELHKILVDQVMIRRLKKDVAKDLPEKERRMITLKLPSKALVEYNKAEMDFLVWLRTISPARANKAKKSPALTKIGYLLRLIAQLKLPLTEKWIEEFFESHPDKKLVAMTMHTSVIDHLHERFKKNSLIVDGRVTGIKRAETVRRFQTDPRFNLFLGNWRAAGIGITLTAADNFVGLDFPWTPGDLVQGEDRIHRIGQKNKCLIHYLAVLGTIEEKLIKILREKSTILDAILNGQKSEDDLDIFEALLQEVKVLTK